MVANILPTDTPSSQGVGSKVQTISYSESSHVAYQIKADEAGSNMVANVLPTDTPSTQGVGSKVKLYLFLKVVMLHIKLREFSTEHHESKHAVITHNNDPCHGVKRSFYFYFLKVVMLHIKLKWKKCRPTCKVTL